MYTVLFITALITIIMMTIATLILIREEFVTNTNDIVDILIDSAMILVLIGEIGLIPVTTIYLIGTLA